jgi:hypothetical protein
LSVGGDSVTSRQDTDITVIFEAHIHAGERLPPQFTAFEADVIEIDVEGAGLRDRRPIGHVQGQKRENKEVTHVAMLVTRLLAVKDCTRGAPAELAAAWRSGRSVCAPTHQQLS